MNQRRRKRTVNWFFHHRFYNGKFIWTSAEDRVWDNMAPVGREFGSPDHERLEAQDWAAFKSNLSSLVEACRGLPEATTGAFEGKELDDALNVQTALMELGHDVNAGVAAAVWRHHSRTSSTDWMPGAETVESARISLYFKATGPAG